MEEPRKAMAWWRISWRAFRNLRVSPPDIFRRDPRWMNPRTPQALVRVDVADAAQMHFDPEAAP